MKPLVAAFGFLTRLPMPQVGADRADFAEAIRWYPLVGVVIGLFVAGAGWAATQLDPWAGALAALVAWIAITGALHLDGLSDLSDGMGAAHGNRDRLLAVMADPHIGSFGVVAIVLQLLAKLVLLQAIAPAGWWPLVAVPFAARTGPLVWARWLVPLHPGLGAAIAGAVRWRDLTGWAALGAAGAVFVPALVVAPVLILAWGWWLKARVGGVTGDCHGAGIELVETGLLVALLLVSRF